MMKKIMEIAADIVQAQASIRQMTPEQIESTLMRTFSVLQKMQKAEDDGQYLEVAVIDEEVPVAAGESERMDPRESIQEDRIVCLECNAKMKQLTGKHLSSHGLTIRQYKQKWGLPLKQSLSARSLSRARSRAAKKRGLPENLVRYQEERKLKKAKLAIEEAPVTVSEAGEPQKRTRIRERQPRK